MSCAEYLEKFVQRLTETDNTEIAAGQAFGEVADYYNIAKVIVDFTVPESIYTREGDHFDMLLFERKGGNAEASYQKEYRTEEGGIALFSLYATADAEAFSQDQIRELDTMFNILFFHGGRWRLINHVKKITLTDNLTGLPNSAGFLNYVDSVLLKEELTLYNAYYFNLTRFSLVNKRFGMKETDMIIVRYARALTDFLVEGECVGRLGGDNFVALIRKERTKTFLKLLQGVQTYGMLGEQVVPIEVGAVAGVMEIDDSITHRGMIIGECATALNIAKYIDKQPYMFATEEIRLRAFREKQVAATFIEALHKKEFKAYYQPKVQIDGYEIVGAEALVRWEHEGKLISPAEFVPVLEQNGMVCMLDFYVLEQVCQDIRGWMERGIDPVRVSVNLSRKHLVNPNLAEEIIQVLERYELESKYIEIELTETVDETESQLLVNFMQQMQKYHVAMSIDDFGTGYSSLNMLRSFPVDVLKLDKTFIDNLEENDKIVLSNIIRMASELNMAVVAEGVENWEQMDYLKEVECKVVQGFLFDRPLPKKDFEGKLMAGNYQIDNVENI